MLPKNRPSGERLDWLCPRPTAEAAALIPPLPTGPIALLYSIKAPGLHPALLPPPCAPPCAPALPDPAVPWPSARFPPVLKLTTSGGRRPPPAESPPGFPAGVHTREED